MDQRAGGDSKWGTEPLVFHVPGQRDRAREGWKTELCVQCERLPTSEEPGGTEAQYLLSPGLKEVFPPELQSPSSSPSGRSLQGFFERKGISLLES